LRYPVGDLGRKNGLAGRAKMFTGLIPIFTSWSRGDPREEGIWGRRLAKRGRNKNCTCGKGFEQIQKFIIQKNEIENES